MRHKMTFSHFSKDLIRPISRGQFEWVITLFVNFLLLGQGESHKVGRGWIKRDYSLKTYLGLNSPVLGTVLKLLGDVVCQTNLLDAEGCGTC
jgi:hypothetical protein